MTKRPRGLQSDAHVGGPRRHDRHLFGIGNGSERPEKSRPGKRAIVDRLHKRLRQTVDLLGFASRQQQPDVPGPRAVKDRGDLRNRFSLAEHGFVEADAPEAIEIENDVGGHDLLPTKAPPLR